MAYDRLVGIDWHWLSMDGTQGKAPLGGKKTGPNPTARAKRDTKRSLLTDGRGIPLGLVVAGANTNDFKLAFDSVPVERPQRLGEQRLHLCLDEG